MVIRSISSHVGQSCGGLNPNPLDLVEGKLVAGSVVELRRPGRLVSAEPGLGEAQEGGAEDGDGVFLGIEAGVGEELVGGVPEAFFQCGVGVVLFRWGDPDHGGSWAGDGACVDGEDRVGE